MAEVVKKLGRPRKFTGYRPNWTIRLQEKYGNQIKEIANESGRSISEVCESLIARALSIGHEIVEQNPSFIIVTAPKQQDEELQVAAVCVEALKRLPSAGGAHQRVLAYLTSRAGDV